jgi:hypothetical protein
MKKIKYIFSEMLILIKTHKLYFLTPLILTLALVTLLVVKFGSSVILAFIYAGV